jgi:hypothetical protein
MGASRWVRVISGVGPEDQHRCVQYQADSEGAAEAQFLEEFPGFEISRREHYISKGR